MSQPSDKVILSVNKLQHATIVNGGNCFFIESELKTSIEFLTEQLQEISELKYLEEHSQSPDWLERWRRHNCISILGQRGIGKTTFLLTLLDRIKDEKYKVKILRIIDPSCLEDKHRFLASVIVRLYQYYEQAENKYDKKDESISDIQDTLDAIAKGLKYLSGTNGNDLPANIFAERQIDNANVDLNLARSIHKFSEIVADLCKVDAFILPIDDVDVAFESTWNVLEVLRRYLACPRLIVVASGDLCMYDMLVTKATWQELYPLIKAEKEISQDGLERYRGEVNKIKEQYLSKLFPHRVLLRSPKNRLISERNKNNIILDFSRENHKEKDCPKNTTLMVPFAELFARLSRDLFGFSLPDESCALDVIVNPGVGLIPETTRNFMRFAKILGGWLVNKDNAKQGESYEPPSLDPLISLFGPALFENNLDSAFLIKLADGFGYSQLAEYVIKRSAKSGSGYLLKPGLEEVKAGDLGMAPLLVHGCYYRGCVKTKAYESFLYYGIRIVLIATEIQNFSRRGLELSGWETEHYINDWIVYLDYLNSPTATIIASRYRSKNISDNKAGEARSNEQSAESDGAKPKRRKNPKATSRMRKDGWAIVNKPEENNFLAQFFSIKQNGIFNEYWLQDIYVGLGRIADFATLCRKQRNNAIKDQDGAVDHAKTLMLIMEISDNLPATDVKDIEVDSSINNQHLTNQKIPSTDDDKKLAYEWPALKDWEILVASKLSMLAVTPSGGVESINPLLHMPGWIVGQLFESLAQNLRTFGNELYSKNNPSHWVAAFLHSLLIHETLWRGRPAAFNSLSFESCCNPKLPTPDKDHFVHNLELLKNCLNTSKFSVRKGDKNQQWGLPVVTLLWACCPPLFAALCVEPQEQSSPCRKAAQLIIDCFDELANSDTYDGNKGEDWKHNILIQALAKEAKPMVEKLRCLMGPDKS
jgi:GTPase SAR1 family protein